MTHEIADVAERELALDKLGEIDEAYRELARLSAQWKKLQPGSTKYEEIAGEMTAIGLVLAAKLHSLDDIFEATGDDDSYRVMERLEEMRSRLGSKGTALSVAAFLNLIGKTLDKNYSELPVQATYFRWLKEAKEGTLRISSSHQELLVEFLDRAGEGLLRGKRQKSRVA